MPTEAFLRQNTIRFQKTSQKGQPDGYAGLGSDGKVPGAQLPSGFSAPAWGGIGGTLSAQTDLSSALAAKASLEHDHSRSYKLAQANTHQSPDTDASTSALHHTLGSGANQAAAGNHTHPGGSEAFPVGAVFIAVVNTNPYGLLGYGTWEAFGAGRVLVGRDAGDPDFDMAEETGGAKTVQSSAQTFAGNALASHQHGVGTYATGNEAAHTHSVTSNVTVADHGAHTHTVTSNVSVGNHTMSGNTGAASAGATQRGSTTSTLTLAAHTHGYGTLAVSAHSVTNNQVTSGNPNAILTHTPTNNAVTSGAGSSHNHSVSGSSESVSGGTPSGTNTPGAATSVVQPYIVVYMWKRTA